MPILRDCFLFRKSSSTQHTEAASNRPSEAAPFIPAQEPICTPRLPHSSHPAQPPAFNGCVSTAVRLPDGTSSVTHPPVASAVPIGEQFSLLYGDVSFPAREIIVTCPKCEHLTSLLICDTCGHFQTEG
jgi:hypothetical protein